MIIITLIHGTWAKNADWIQTSSPLALALKRELPSPVEVKSLNWSGRNLHYSRWRAAKFLRHHILSVSRDYPSADHYLIAHSHGGNVAAYALKDETSASKIAGLVCLSTPFIQCRKRAFPEEFVILPIGLLGSLACIALLAWLPDSLGSFAVGFSVLFAFVVGILLLGVARAFILRLATGKWSGSLHSVYEGLYTSFRTGGLNADRILIIRAPGDEASAALSTSSFIAWLFGRLSRSLEKIHSFGCWLETLNSRLGWPRRILAASLFLTISCMLFRRIVDLNLFNWWLLGLNGLMIAIAGAFLQATGFDIFASLIRVLYAALVIPLLFLCGLFSWAFGFDTALLACLFEFSVEVAPVGKFSVVSLTSATSSGLWHSLPYSDPEGIATMIEWIKTTSTSKDS